MAIFSDGLVAELGSHRHPTLCQFFFLSLLHLFREVVGIEAGDGNLHIPEWGELLAYGDRVTKANVPDEILSKSEFMHFRERNQPHLFEGAMLSVTIRDVARDNGINSIGGRVMIGVADQSGLHVLGDMQGLIPFVKYNEITNAGAQAKLGL